MIECDVFNDYVRIREESAEVYFKTKFRNAAVRCLKYEYVT
jgi:hypothetical protein